MEVIAAEGGRVTFGRFMEIALTHPTLGYYSRVDRLLWHGGDFSTAPAISPFFNKTLARLVTELVDASLAAATIDTPSVVELGGGEGHLAEAVLRYWHGERPELRGKIAYRILEVGAGLQRRQAAAVEEFAAAGWEVGWGADLEEACAGTRPVVIVGNEFVDAMPVHLVAVGGDSLREAYVQLTPPSLVQTWGELSAAAAAEIELLFGTLDPRRLAAFTEDGILEVFPGLGELDAAGSHCHAFGKLREHRLRRVVPGFAPGRRTLGPGGTHQAPTDSPGLLQAPDGPRSARPSGQAGSHRRRGLRGARPAWATGRSRDGRLHHPRRVPAGGRVGEELRALRAATAADGTAVTATAADGAASDPLEADRQATVLENLLDERDLGGAFKLMVQVKE